ncbi:hypothetical protein LWI28_022730 [Acer negundo]|uniref:Uncharacterized protein n=1 Tax=Acer negundo TaxID=4023 RepID=A0AAD5INQ6_ACENE|nr:hypothetical protein LWI28_022730 [Acer negundo]
MRGPTASTPSIAPVGGPTIDEGGATRRAMELLRKLVHFNQPEVGGGAVLETVEQVLLSSGGKKGLKGKIMGQHLSLISVTALQQAGPILPMRPVSSID